MDKPQRYRLRLTKLDFVSLVDTPAQPNATTLLFKRAPGGSELEGTARFVKVDEDLGLAFFWAFTCTNPDGTEHFDRQSDTVDQDFVKAAMDFMLAGGAVDEMHDEQPSGARVVFGMPMDSAIAAAYGIPTKKTGFMVAIKPTADQMAKLKSGELNGVSIGGAGYREAIKAMLSTADRDNLPDSAFLYIEPGGKKVDGKTEPRSKRMFPYKNASGKIDIDHLRDACGRIPQSSLDAALKEKLQQRAEKLLAAQHTDKRFGGARKQVVLTDEVDGHQHAIDLDDPAGWCGDNLSTSYATMEGADTGHAHVWTFDAQTGAITIGADSGHTHAIDGVVPASVLAVFALNERADDAEAAQTVLERVLDGDAPAGNVSVTVAARARRSNSTPASGARTVVSTQEGSMPDVKDTQIADLTKRLDRLSLIAKLSGALKTYFDTLSEPDADAFLAKSATERESLAAAAVAKANEGNEVVYTSPVDGTVYRKRDDERLVAMAKREAEAHAAFEKAEIRAVAKSHMGALTGGDDLHDFIVGAVRKSGGTVEQKQKALEAIKGWNAGFAKLGVAEGIDPGNDPEAVGSMKGAYQALAKGLKAFCATEKIADVWTVGLTNFVQTPEGAALQSAYDNAKAKNAA